MPQILKETLRNNKMTTRQVAEWLQIPVSTVSRWAKQNLIPATQTKTKWLYNPKKVIAWEYVNQELLALCKQK